MATTEKGSVDELTGNLNPTAAVDVTSVDILFMKPVAPFSLMIVGVN